MKLRPHTLVSITLGILLLASTYFVGVTAQVNPYDPWVDYNEDGQIDIFDVVEVATRYDTTGDPTKNVNVTNWPYRYPWYPSGNYTQKIVIFSTEALLNQPNPIYRGGVYLDDNSDFAFLFQPLSKNFSVTQACIVTALHNIHSTKVENTRFSVRINGVSQEFSTAMSVGEKFLSQASLILNTTLTDTIRQGINTMKLSSEGWFSGTSQWYTNCAFEIVLLIEYEYLA